MITNNQQILGKTLWSIANDLRGAMMADDFRDYMLSFLFWKYLSDNYLKAAQKELGSDYPDNTPEDIMYFTHHLFFEQLYVILIFVVPHL